MNAIDYILLGGAAVVIALVIYHLVKRKKQGKGGCGCGCVGCPSAGNCQKTQNTEEEK